MHIVHVTSELAPIAKVGGLGDMIQGLGKALSREGEKVEIILPFYDSIDRKKLNNLKVEMQDLPSYEGQKECLNTIWSAEVDSLQVFLIEPQGNIDYFKRGTIYGEKDDIKRFAYFSRTALEFLLKSDRSPDILNLHDWITSLCAPLYYELFKPLGLSIKAIVTTLHNMQYQGVCKKDTLSEIGLDADVLLTADKMQDHKKSDQLNLLQGGLIYSDFLTTVSPTYAEEIKGEKGFGLGPLLVENQKKMRGILNGIDTEYWNPETDPHLAKNYVPSAENLEGVLDAKKANRKHLSECLNIEFDKVPLFGVVTRLVEQKGPELIQYGLEYALKKGGQFVLLGTPYEKNVKDEFYAFRDAYQDNPHVCFHFEFNEKFAHLAFAACDFLLIPSLFEPCGLTQMIALRYGTIPIVHNVGGLHDTIFDIDHTETPAEKRNGYTFDFPSPDSLRWSIDRAFEHIKHDEAKHTTMLKNGLNHDWSWKNSALAYVELYREILEN